MDIAPLEGGRGNRLIQIQLPAILAHRRFIGIGIVQHQVTQQLVTAVGCIGSVTQGTTRTFADKGIIHQLLCLVTLALKQQFPDHRQ